MNAFIRPTVSHALAVAVRFRDVFTRGPITGAERLRVSFDPVPYVPGGVAAPWRSVAVRNGIHRFLVSNGATAPTGTLDLRVEDPRGVYALFEPVTIVLPRPLVAHPPIPAAVDFNVDVDLWPTWAWQPTAGETVVRGGVVSAGGGNIAGLRVRAGRAPLAPVYTYTDAGGSFVFRLLGTAYAPTPAVPSPVPIVVELRAPPAFGSTLPITTLRRDGAVVTSPFPIPLGHTSTLSIIVP